MKSLLKPFLTIASFTMLVAIGCGQTKRTVADCGQIPTKPYLVEIAQLGFCQMQENRKLNSVSSESHYYFCDSTYFKVYSLTKLKDKILLEITKNTGTGGYHYYFLNVGDNQKFNKVGFFQGYLDSLSCKETNKVIFTAWIDNYNYTVEYIQRNEGFEFNKIIRIQNNKGHDIPSDMFDKLEKKNGEPEKWEL